MAIETLNHKYKIMKLSIFWRIEIFCFGFIFSLDAPFVVISKKRINFLVFIARDFCFYIHHVMISDLLYRYDSVYVRTMDQAVLCRTSVFTCHFRFNVRWFIMVWIRIYNKFKIEWDLHWMTGKGKYCHQNQLTIILHSRHKPTHSYTNVFHHNTHTINRNVTLFSSIKKWQFHMRFK